MPVTDIVLKNNVFLTLEDAKAHLKIKDTTTEYDNKVKRLLQMSTDMCEKYIEGPIKTREFTETRDGDSSDTIVPDYYPVRTIEEIRVDYNRAFGNDTIVNSKSYVVRGSADLAVGIKGSDVVIRDDNHTSIVGRIFTGSVAGALQIKYTAGWGADMSEIPFDLQHAVLMTMEYFYILGENRELNVKSKNNSAGGSQSYSRDAGLPKEVREILDSYKDYGFGRNNKPQRNTFVI